MEWILDRYEDMDRKTARAYFLDSSLKNIIFLKGNFKAAANEHIEYFLNYDRHGTYTWPVIFFKR